MRYTPFTLSSGAGVCPLHDTIIIDPYSTFMELCNQSRQFYRHFRKNSQLQAALPAELVARMKGFPQGAFSVLSGFYQGQRGWGNFRRSEEPTWINFLSHQFRKVLTVTHVMKDGTDPLAILPNLPFHGIGYVIEEGGLIESLFHCFHLARLAHIKQLAYLHDPQTEHSQRQVDTNFPHTRLVHIYDATVVANLVIANNPELELLADEIRTGVLLHDVLTPAGGDTTKMIDRQAFDEDAHFSEILTAEQWEEFARMYGVRIGSLSKMIQGQGITGAVLDLCDKASYLARDLDLFLFRGRYNGPFHYPETYLPLLEITRNNPHVCALWAHAKVKGGKLVIDDAEALQKFLLVRALLFQGLYYNPYSKILEHIVAKKFIGWAYHTGKLSREILLTWRDEDLRQWLTIVTGLEFFISVLDGCGVEEFERREDAVRRQEKLDADPDMITVLEEFTPYTSDGTASFLVEKSGKVMTFRDAYPEWSGLIRSAIEVPRKPFRLYRASMDSLQVGSIASLRQELKAFQCPPAFAGPTTYLPLRPQEVRWHSGMEVLCKVQRGLMPMH